MSRAFDIESYVPSYYGQEDYTFKEGIENNKLKVVKENSLETNFKDVYYCQAGLLSFRMKKSQVKKYVEVER